MFRNIRWILLLAFLVPASAAAADAPNSCLACHSALRDQRLSAPAKLFSDVDVHRDKGFACVDCHGGNPVSSDKA